MKTRILIKLIAFIFIAFGCLQIVQLVVQLFPRNRSVILVAPEPRSTRFDNFGLIRRVVNSTFFTVAQKEASQKCIEGKEEDRLRASRDLLSAITQGYLKSDDYFPEDIPTVVHLTWCGNKKFRFEDHLGVLSIVRILRPVKIVFHYNDLPKPNQYHTWFQELRQSLPQLVLRKTDKMLRCNTSDSLNYALEQLAASLGGGIYVGERAALAYIPSEWKRSLHLTYMVTGSVSSESMIVFIKHGIVSNTTSLDAFKINVLNATKECNSVEQFNTAVENRAAKGSVDSPDVYLSPCIALPAKMYPEHIVNVSTPFAEVARIFFYGKSKLMGAKPSQDPTDLIPSISHYISLAKEPGKPVEWTFSHYLSILSALYVAGFEKVYVHGDQVPVGEWWDRLQNEQVIFVYTENIETVFQQKVNVLAHQSDILRSLILMKFGGAYQDRDVVWGNSVPEYIRRFPTLMSYDWPDYGDWPRANNMGVLMSKAKSPFLYKFLDTFWLEKDSDWGYNGILMPYKVFEYNPESVYIYEKLQLICYLDVCHPTWHPGYIRPYSMSREPTGNFSLDEPLAYHFTYPKPDPSFVSFETIKSGTNVAAKIGKRILDALEKAGKHHLLK